MSLAVPGRLKNQRRPTTSLAPEQNALKGRIQEQHDSLMSKVQGEQKENDQGNDKPVQGADGKVDNTTKGDDSNGTAVEGDKGKGGSEGEVGRESQPMGDAEAALAAVAVEERLKAYAAPIIQVAPNPEEEEEQKTEKIEILSAIEAFSGCYALVEEEDSLIINTFPLWETLWQRCLCAAPPLVDFSEYTAAAVFLGRREQYGWAVKWHPPRKWQQDTLVEFEILEPLPLTIKKGKGDNAVKEEVTFTQFSQPYFIRVFELFPGTKQGLLRQRFRVQEQTLERGGSAAVTSATARAKYNLLDTDSDED